jgi:hypothetical protein
LFYDWSWLFRPHYLRIIYMCVFDIEITILAKRHQICTARALHPLNNFMWVYISRGPNPECFKWPANNIFYKYYENLVNPLCSYHPSILSQPLSIHLYTTNLWNLQFYKLALKIQSEIGFWCVFWGLKCENAIQKRSVKLVV